VNAIELAQDQVHCWALVLTVLILQILLPERQLDGETINTYKILVRKPFGEEDGRIP
jgi:hypothetical protein